MHTSVCIRPFIIWLLLSFVGCSGLPATPPDMPDAAPLPEDYKLTVVTRGDNYEAHFRVTVAAPWVDICVQPPSAWVALLLADGDRYWPLGESEAGCITPDLLTWNHPELQPVQSYVVQGPAADDAHDVIVRVRCASCVFQPLDVTPQGK
jgi:hypothetical protein